ncbi:MAG TPA: DEAD/DEAH box helicase family protein, partial [Solirubrobacteraceae bacterium]|nr:DEAD/DEAH box helicase family protein [Solirubrobacteraceae bacterium]
MPQVAHVEPLTSARSLRGPFDYRLPRELAAGVGVGSMLVVPFGRREILGVVVGISDHSELPEDRLLAPLRALELGSSAEMVALAEWVAREYCSTPSRALSLVLPPDARRRLSGRRRRAPARAPATARSPDASPAPALTPDQRGALASLEEALRDGRAERRLLHGVTGSGKTEVYMRAAALALARGRGVIVLVPEIALTPQICARFAERFGDTVAVLHSQLRPAERYAE